MIVVPVRTGRPSPQQSTGSPAEVAYSQLVLALNSILIMMCQADVMHAPPAECEEIQERRVSARIAIACPVEIRLPSGSRQAALVDMSKTGAKIRLADPPIAGAFVLLRWQDQECFATVNWLAGDICGLAFHRSISDEAIIPTLAANPIRRGPVAKLTRMEFGKKRGAPLRSLAGRDPTPR